MVTSCSGNILQKELFRKITEVIKNSNGSKFSMGWNPAERRYYFENGRYVKMLTQKSTTDAYNPHSQLLEAAVNY